MTSLLSRVIFSSDKTNAKKEVKKEVFPYKIVPFYPESKNRMMQPIDPNGE